MFHSISLTGLTHWMNIRPFRTARKTLQISLSLRSKQQYHWRNWLSIVPSTHEQPAPQLQLKCNVRHGLNKSIFLETDRCMYANVNICIHVYIYSYIHTRTCQVDREYDPGSSSRALSVTPCFSKCPATVRSEHMGRAPCVVC